MKSTKRIFRVDRKEIAFLKFIIESYDGIAVITTLEAAAGIVAIYVAPGCEEELNIIIQDLKKDILIKEITAS